MSSRAGIRPGATVIVLGLALAYLALGAQAWAGGLFRAPWDKAAHLVAYALLTLLLMRLHRNWSALQLMLAVALFGLVDELMQCFVPGRSGDVFDWLADVAAAGFTCLATNRVTATRGSEEGK